MNELAAFENFKFNIGDLVVHISDDPPDRPKGIIIERTSVQTSGGFLRGYRISFRVSEVIAEEIELLPWQRPIRM